VIIEPLRHYRGSRMMSGSEARGANVLPRRNQRPNH